VGKFTTGNVAALRHGATSRDRFAPLARNHRRRVLRQIGLSPRDLDAVGRGYLALYCATAAKLDLLDAYFAEHGFLKADGEPQPGAKIYTSLANSSQRALARLEAHVRDRGDVDPLLALEAEGRRIRELREAS